jgi:hypothetical protein
MFGQLIADHVILRDQTRGFAEKGKGLLVAVWVPTTLVWTSDEQEDLRRSRTQVLRDHWTGTAWSLAQITPLSCVLHSGADVIPTQPRAPPPQSTRR